MVLIPRRTHVKRLFGRSNAGEDRDIYVDVQFVDSLLTNTLSEGQMTQVDLAWDNSNQSRVVTEKRLTDPANPPSDPTNPDVWIPINVIDTITLLDQEGRETNLLFDNSAANEQRQVIPTRVTHWDTNVDALLNDGGTVDNTPFDGAETFLPNPSYKKTPGTEDASTYIDVEVCTDYGTKSNVDNVLDTYNQETTNALQNGYIIGDLRRAPEGALPVRLDPLQNILNVNWESKIYIALMITGQSDLRASTEFEFPAQPVVSADVLRSDVKLISENVRNSQGGSGSGDGTFHNTVLTEAEFLFSVDKPLNPSEAFSFALSSLINSYGDVIGWGINAGVFLQRNETPFIWPTLQFPVSDPSLMLWVSTLGSNVLDGHNLFDSVVFFTGKAQTQFGKVYETWTDKPYKPSPTSTANAPASQNLSLNPPPWADTWLTGRPPAFL